MITSNGQLSHHLLRPTMVLRCGLCAVRRPQTVIMSKIDIGIQYTSIIPSDCWSVPLGVGSLMFSGGPHQLRPVTVIREHTLGDAVGRRRIYPISHCSSSWMNTSNLCWCSHSLLAIYSSVTSCIAGVVG